MPLSRDSTSFEDLLQRSFELGETLRDFWWRPEGRRRLRQHAVGAELRNFTALGGRPIVDVPLRVLDHSTVVRSTP